MKGIILPLLISYIFCINYLPKYGTIKVTEKSGYFYLNTSEFDDDSTLHIQLTIKRGNIVSTLLYEFTNISPNSYSSTPSNTLTPATSSTTSTGSKRSKTITSRTYYYNIQNNNKYQYLIIQYMGLSGEYLEIESTSVNVGILVIVLICSFFGLIILAVIGFFIYRICRKKTNLGNTVTQTVFQNPYEKPYYSNDPQYNSGYYNSNYPQQQQLQDINNGPSINN